MTNNPTLPIVEKLEAVRPCRMTDLLPHRCVKALREIDALQRHARTDAVDMVERIEAICAAALKARHIQAGDGE